MEQVIEDFLAISFGWMKLKGFGREHAGGFRELRGVQERQGLGGRVGVGAPGTAFLPGRTVKSEQTRVNVLALAVGVEAALVLRLVLRRLPNLVAGAIHHLVGFVPVRLWLVGKKAGYWDLVFGGAMEKARRLQGGVADLLAGEPKTGLPGVEAVGRILLGQAAAGDRAEAVGARGD